MPIGSMSDREPVRLNELDWKILERMSDGKRYTQVHIAKDLPEFEDETYDWVRQRVSTLYQNGLVQKVGSSSMYEISDLGRAALDLKDEYDGGDFSPAEFGKMVHDHAADNYNS